MRYSACVWTGASTHKSHRHRTQVQTGGEVCCTQPCHALSLAQSSSQPAAYSAAPRYRNTPSIHTGINTRRGVDGSLRYHMCQSNLFSTAWGNQRNNIFLRHTERKSTAHLREHAGLHRERAVVQPPTPVPPHSELHTKRDILPLRAGGVEPCQGRPRHGAATQREHTRTTTHAALSRACARVGVYRVGERDWCDGGPGGRQKLAGLSAPILVFN